jgi:hypothetical protein
VLLAEYVMTEVTPPQDIVGAGRRTYAAVLVVFVSTSVPSQ